MLCTTADLGVLRGCVLHESLDIYRKLRLLDVLRAIGHAVVVVPRTIMRCASYGSSWPRSDHDRYPNVSLQAIRGQFGITVAHPAPH
ncbi:MAG: hypothetical protein B7Y51_04800 [Burkholderiales bacterium 28-67-8]|nr:MAG: hypothetical protein B7Y51_04800 [Burkholderiales bacterium 28-67-8]